MSSEPLSRVVTGFLRVLLQSPKELTLAQQRVLLAGLAYSGHFEDPVRSLLLTAAEVAGDIDEIVVEMLHDHLQWRRAAQKEAQDPPDSRSTWK